MQEKAVSTLQSTHTKTHTSHLTIAWPLNNNEVIFSLGFEGAVLAQKAYGEVLDSLSLWQPLMMNTIPIFTLK